MKKQAVAKVVIWALPTLLIPRVLLADGANAEPAAVRFTLSCDYVFEKEGSPRTNGTVIFSIELKNGKGRYYNWSDTNPAWRDMEKVSDDELTLFEMQQDNRHYRF